MEKSESITKLATALRDFQGKLRTLKKSADNPYFHSAYTPLEDIWGAIRDSLAANGLAVMQFPSQTGLETVVTHVSGEWIACDSKWDIDASNPQKIGSAITYMRRYGLCSVLGIVTSEEDDDGNKASHDAPPEPSPKPRKRGPNQKKDLDLQNPKAETVTEEQVVSLVKAIEADPDLDIGKFNTYLAAEKGMRLDKGVPDYGTLLKKDLAGIMSMLETARKKHESSKKEGK